MLPYFCVFIANTGGHIQLGDQGFGAHQASYPNDTEDTCRMHDRRSVKLTTHGGLECAGLYLNTPVELHSSLIVQDVCATLAFAMVGLQVFTACEITRTCATFLPVSRGTGTCDWMLNVHVVWVYPAFLTLSGRESETVYSFIPSGRLSSYNFSLFLYGRLVPVLSGSVLQVSFPSSNSATMHLIIQGVSFKRSSNCNSICKLFL
jgi:hypothetical protein